MKRFLSAAFAAATILAPQAGASVYVEGTGEPAFTRSTTNTQWIRWVGHGSYQGYKVEFEHTANGVHAGTQSTGALSPNGAGSMWVDWAGVATLQEGTTYGICAKGRYQLDGLWYPEAGTCADTSKRTSTTIDLTKPTIAVAIDGGAAYSRTGRLGYRIDYTDNLAFPFPANFTCRSSCATASLTYDASCSTPNEMKRVTYFTCTDDRSAAADGPVEFCVASADAAIPDNRNSADQSGSAAAANISAKTCDTITIDRTAPTAAVAASATTVKVGDVVTFAAQASDATSGIASHAWTWGDGTSGASGDTATHAFATAGTYEVVLRTADNAGNETTARQTITVQAPPAPQPQPEPAGDDPAGDDEGDWLPEPADPAELTVRTVRRLKLTNATRTLPVELSATGPGTATLSLRRAGRRHVERSLELDDELRHYRLRLPRGLAAGTYVLAVRWAPLDDEDGFSTTQRKIRFVKTVRRSTVRASAASAAPPIDRAGAPVGLPLG